MPSILYRGTVRMSDNCIVLRVHFWNLTQAEMNKITFMIVKQKSDFRKRYLFILGYKEVKVCFL